MAQFSDKVALVTGSVSGIGQTTAQFYARERAKVVISDVDVEGGKETVEMIKSDAGEACFFKADVSNPEDCENLVQPAINEYGRLDSACTGTLRRDAPASFSENYLTERKCNP